LLPRAVPSLLTGRRHPSRAPLGRSTPYSRFTIRFGADGRASLRLDCNRGTGQWKATPAADGVSGQLQFGPIAATRALCPPPHLDERVARDLGYVRGYLLKDGNLYMSLMADAGIYEWRPLRGE
jgi:heat shock protein HslJ